MRTRTAWAAALAVACASLATPVGASAHTGVKSYSPKRGSTVARDLGVVRVTFKGRIVDGKLTVRTASGSTVSRGDGTVVRRDRRLRVRLRSGLKAGRYTATMRVLHTDGHVMTKSWSFNLR
jgi:methionine-rich copper-binding protein CopC